MPGAGPVTDMAKPAPAAEMQGNLPKLPHDVIVERAVLGASTEAGDVAGWIGQRRIGVVRLDGTARIPVRIIAEATIPARVPRNGRSWRR